MRKSRALVALGVLLLLTLTASSARADSLRADELKVKLNHGQGHHLLVFAESRAELISLFPEVFEGNNGLHLGLLKNAAGKQLGVLKNNGQVLEFENNNGKHLGFTMSSVTGGAKRGPLNVPQSSAGGSAIPNPEPAAVFLLGTGLAAGGAYARKRFRKTRH